VKELTAGTNEMVTLLQTWAPAHQSLTARTHQSAGY